VCVRECVSGMVMVNRTAPPGDTLDQEGSR